MGSFRLLFNFLLVFFSSPRLHSPPPLSLILLFFAQLTITGLSAACVVHPSEFTIPTALFILQPLLLLILLQRLLSFTSPYYPYSSSYPYYTDYLKHVQRGTIKVQSFLNACFYHLKTLILS